MIIFSAPSRGQQVLTPLGVEQTTSLLVVLICPALGGGSTYPTGGRGSYGASGRSAPLPRLPGGGPHFSREMGRKRAGAPPLDPGFS